MDVMPKWAEVILVPLISLILAAILSALVILAIGESPLAALKLMIDGALGSTYRNALFSDYRYASRIYILVKPLRAAVSFGICSLCVLRDVRDIPIIIARQMQYNRIGIGGLGEYTNI